MRQNNLALSERLWLATFFLWHFYGYDDGGGRSGIQIEGTLEGQVGWGRSSANYLQEACVQFTATAAQECGPLIDTVQFLYRAMSFSSQGLRERAQTAVAKNRGGVNFFFAPEIYRAKYVLLLICPVAMLTSSSFSSETTENTSRTRPLFPSRPPALIRC